MPTSYWLKFGNTPLGYNGSGVQFTHVEQPGTLTVSLAGTGTGFDTAKNFNVLVTFGSAISYTVDGTPVATPSATCTLTLHAGQVSVVGNIPFGTTFTISEAISDYDNYMGYSLQSITVTSGTMTDGGIIHSVVNNVYSYGLGSVSLQLDNAARSILTFATSGYITLDGVQSQTRKSTLSFDSITGTASHSITTCPQGNLSIELPSFSSSRLYYVVCTWKDSSGTEHTQTFNNRVGSTSLNVGIYCYPGYTTSVAITKMA